MASIPEPDLVAELFAIVRALDAARVPFAVCGGLAVTLHGAVRSTKDIDLLVPERSLEAALSAVAREGFTLPAEPMLFGAGTPEERRVQRVSKTIGRHLLTLDLLAVTPVFEDVWQDRTIVASLGASIPVVSLRGLAKMKRLAGRKQDLADIETLGLEDPPR